MSKAPSWLYKPANISEKDAKLIRLEILYFLNNWCKSRNIALQSLQSQFIGEVTSINEFHTNSVLRRVLTDMKIEHLFNFLSFIVVTENRYFPIHIDHYNTDWMSFGLNIPILNCDGSKTVWYDSLPDENDDMPDYISELTVHGKIAMKCVQDHVQEIGSCDANVPHWINVSVPHAPKCTHSKLRINSSLRFHSDIYELLDDGTFENLMVKK
jgi:hypothetical protein